MKPLYSQYTDMRPRRTASIWVKAAMLICAAAWGGFVGIITLLWIAGY